MKGSAISVATFQQETVKRLHPTNASRHLRPRHQGRRMSVMASFIPSETKVLVAGGGGVALKTARILRDASCTVDIVQRSSTRAEEIASMGATMHQVDVLNRDEVADLFSSLGQVDVVMSSVGGPPSDPLPDSEGNINLIEMSHKFGVKKFVLVSSIGVGDSKDAVSKAVYEVLEPVLLAKEKAEDRLKACTDMDWVIVRPGGLKSEAATGKGVLTKDITICGSIQREDVASLVKDCIFSDKTKNLVLSAVDSEQLYGAPQFEVYRL